MNWTNDDWLTPPEVLERLGDFALDPCSSLVRPWDTAERHLTIADDGLKTEWIGRVWLNPPYSDVEPWLKKMTTHRNGMALLNSNTETQWFYDGIWKAATAVMFFKGRLRFYRPDGTRGTTGKSASIIAAYTEQDASILYQAGFNGQFVPLVITFTPNIRSTWRKLVRAFLKECGGTASLEQLYSLAAGHPKVASNPNWKAKVRQIVNREAKRIGPALYQQTVMI